MGETESDRSGIQSLVKTTLKVIKSQIEWSLKRDRRCFIMHESNLQLFSKTKREKRALEFEIRLCHLLSKLFNLFMLNFFMGKMKMIIVSIHRVDERIKCSNVYTHLMCCSEHSKSLIDISHYYT